jgi:branched-chain amino acid transport system substrate-binding protein
MRRTLRGSALGPPVRPALALMLCVVLVAACGESEPAASGGASEGDQVVIGAITGLTGDEAAFGVPWSQGAELASKELEGKGFRIAVQDSQSTPTQAVTAAKKLVEVDGAKVLICGCYSGTFFPVQAYAASKGVLVVNAGSSSPKIRTLNGSVVSLLALDDTVAEGLAAWAYELGHRRGAFVVGNDPYSVGMKDGVTAAFQNQGGEIVENAIVKPGQPDYRPELQKLAAANPDVIFSTSFSNDAKLQFKQGLELGIDAPWFELYPTVSGLEEFADAHGRLFGLEIGWLEESAGEWRARFADEFDSEPTTPWPALAYDASRLTADAIAAAPDADEQGLVDAFVKATETYEGPSGTVELDDDLTRVNQPLQRLKLVEPGEFVPGD